MAIKVGINGFGRIGRVALRIMVERGSATYQMCGINLRNADLDYMVYQVKYDSVFKTFQGTVERDDRHLIINGKKIRVYSEDDAAKNSMKGIITCTNDQVVSSDLTGFSETCIFDETAGIMLDNNFVKLIAWYDNEWGYTNKILDLMAYMHTADQSR